jgi:multidrug transporter EmrE-like cation transporter
MSYISFVGIALSAVLLIVALLTSSVPIAYSALTGIALVCVDAYLTVTRPQDPNS